MATIARKITVKQGTRRSTTPLAATVALALATVGLAACSQPAVLEQTPVVRSEHLVPRDTVLVATSDPMIVLTETDDPMIVLTETDAVQAMSTDGAAITRISINSPSGQNRVYGPMYASAAGSAGGRITQGVTDQDGAWSDDIAWGYGDLAEWQAQTAAASAKDEEGEADAPMSPQCAELARNADADLGAVLKAGCEPTLAQMSALMDNPLGNVAMWINQYDFYKMENAANGKTADKHNYMGIV
jgi:hypothetical protein